MQHLIVIAGNLRCDHPVLPPHPFLHVLIPTHSRHVPSSDNRGLSSPSHMSITTYYGQFKLVLEAAGRVENDNGHPNKEWPCFHLQADSSNLLCSIFRQRSSSFPFFALHTLLLWCCGDAIAVCPRLLAPPRQRSSRALAPMSVAFWRSGAVSCGGSSLMVSLSSLPVKRNGTW